MWYKCKERRNHFFLFASSSSFCDSDKPNDDKKVEKMLTDLRLPDLAPALVPGLSAALAESAISFEVAFLTGNFARRFVDGSSRNREGTAGGLSVEVITLNIKS